MHVGCCEKCRFIDLVENHPNGCPRCGGHFVSLCVDSVHWNRLNTEGRKALVMHILTEPKLRPASIPEFELDPEFKKTVIDDLVKKADDRDVQVRHAKDAVHESRMVEMSVQKAQQDLLRSVIDEKKATQEYAFICSKCGGIAGHVRRFNKYYCIDCGSEMLDSGYSFNYWQSFPKEKQDKLISDAQFQHKADLIHNIRISDKDHK